MDNGTNIGKRSQLGRTTHHHRPPSRNGHHRLGLESTKLQNDITIRDEGKAKCSGRGEETGGSFPSLVCVIQPQTKSSFGRRSTTSHLRLPPHPLTLAFSLRLTIPSTPPLQRYSSIPWNPMALTAPSIFRISVPVGMMRQSDYFLLRHLERLLNLGCGRVEAEHLPVFPRTVHPPALGRQAGASEV